MVLINNHGKLRRYNKFSISIYRSKYIVKSRYIAIALKHTFLCWLVQRAQAVAICGMTSLYILGFPHFPCRAIANLGSSDSMHTNKELCSLIRSYAITALCQFHPSLVCVSSKVQARATLSSLPKGERSLCNQKIMILSMYVGDF